MWTLRSGSMRIVRPLTAMRQPAKMRWPPLPRAGGGYSRHTYQAIVSVATMAANV
jgi:hypothetical protein